MRHVSLSCVLAAVASFGTVLATSGEARADEGAPPAADAAPSAAAPASEAPGPAAPALAPAGPATAAEKPLTADDDDPFRPVTLTANPLSLLLGRIGLNVEYLPVKHHGIVLNPYFQLASAGTDELKTSYTNYGAELGYHFYTGSRGANGFFVGPSLVFMQSNASTKSSLAGQTNEAKNSTLVYGAALDLGGQHVTKGGFTIGAGVGVMYLTASSSSSANQTSSTIKVSGVLPRFLFTIGYSF